MRFILAILGVLGSVCMAAGPVSAEGPQAQLDTLLTARWQADRPGGAVVALKGGKVVYQAYRGMANMDQHVPITATTPFNYASVTKQFTAATVLGLADAGKLSLDARLGDYLDGLPGATADITLEQLLTHTSGVPSMIKYEDGHAYTTAELVHMISALPLDFAPGTKANYSNNGYLLLGAVIAKVPGKPWYEAELEAVVQPLGLASIAYRPQQKAALAIGYHEKGSDVFPAPEVDPTVLHAAGALTGTVGDLAHWIDSFEHGRVVSQAAVTKARTKPKLKGGKTGFFGMGMWHIGVRGHDALEQSGGISGTSVDTLYFPEADLTVVTAANVPNDAQDLARRTAAILLGDPYRTFKAQPPAEDKVKALIGTYRYKSRSTEVFSVTKGAPFLKYNDYPPAPVYYAGDNIYFYGAKDLSWFTVGAQADGTPTLSMHPGGEKEAHVAVRIPAESANR